MTRVDLLVPTRSDIDGAVRVAQECLHMEGSHDVRVLVSVSDPTHQKAIASALHGLNSSRIDVLPAAGDLSLYGNFRRLVHASDAEWVSICADDDAKAPDFVRLTLGNALPTTVGLSPAISLREFDRTTSSFGRELRYVQPSLTGQSVIAQAAHVEASWIFGLWRRTWLAQAFPRDDWDWIDCAIVQRAIVERSFQLCAEASSIICGWNPERQPWSVGSQHSTSRWEEYWLDSVLPGSQVPSWKWKLFVRSRFRRTAKLLNKRAGRTLESPAALESSNTTEHGAK